MNKSEIFDRMKLKKKDRQIIEKFLAEIQLGVQCEGRVCIQGFGTFKKVAPKPRMTYNPQTKVKALRPQKIRMSFSTGENVLRYLNQERL